MSRFLIRFDDIHPEMNHNNFLRMIDLMSVYGIKGILGVIPDNRDKGLQKSNVDFDFWKKIKDLENNGFGLPNTVISISTTPNREAYFVLTQNLNLQVIPMKFKKKKC